MPTYKFRVLKTTWGVAIDLTAEYLLSQETAGTYPITDWLFLKTSHIGSDEISYLVQGLQYAAKHLLPHLNAPYMVIHVQQIEYNFLDFQEEGLTFAMLGWAIQTFGLNLVLPEITYDRATNRYNFPLLLP